jgi:uncharacterized protein involved in response to NO
MIFGFTAAIVSGVVLTALPSWAGTEEIKQQRLASLVFVWFVGRLVMALPLLPAATSAIVDCALFPLMAAMLTPQLLRVQNKWYLLVLPGLLCLAAANVNYHLGVMSGDAARASFGLHLAIYTLCVLYTLKSGVMIPIFTSNERRAHDRGDEIPRHTGLEIVAVLSIAALAWADLGAWPDPWVGAIGVFACAANAARLLRWRGWSVADLPIVFVMHLGIAWLVLALGLRAAAAFSEAVPPLAWVHAFTVGGMGLCMTVLMTRVVLRHTGRPVLTALPIRAAYQLMFLAATLRLVWSFWPLYDLLLQASALLWIAAFAIYLGLFGAMFWKPSLPRVAKPGAKA